MPPERYSNSNRLAQKAWITLNGKLKFEILTEQQTYKVENQFLLVEMAEAAEFDVIDLVDLCFAI